MAEDIWQAEYVQIHLTPRVWDNPRGLPRLGAWQGVAPPWWKSTSCRFNCRCSSQGNSGPGFCLFTVLLLRARPRTRPTVLDQGSNICAVETVPPNIDVRKVPLKNNFSTPMTCFKEVNYLPEWRTKKKGKILSSGPGSWVGWVTQTVCQHAGP